MTFRKKIITIFSLLWWQPKEWTWSAEKILPDKGVSYSSFFVQFSSYSVHELDQQPYMYLPFSARAVNWWRELWKAPNSCLWCKVAILLGYRSFRSFPELKLFNTSSLTREWRLLWRLGPCWRCSNTGHPSPHPEGWYSDLEDC